MFAERLAACFPLAAAWGVAYPRLSVRRMRARWGSCGASGHIILNLRLIQRRPELIDYVVIHELCHLKQFNHSNRFWQLVEKHDPTYNESVEWLKTNGVRIEGALR